MIRVSQKFWSFESCILLEQSQIRPNFACIGGGEDRVDHWERALIVKGKLEKKAEPKKGISRYGL